MATRRLFIALAAALRAHSAPDSLVLAVGDVLQAENPAFDRARFNAAAMAPEAPRPAYAKPVRPPRRWLCRDPDSMAHPHVIVAATKTEAREKFAAWLCLPRVPRGSTIVAEENR